MIVAWRRFYSQNCHIYHPASCVFNIKIKATGTWSSRERKSSCHGQQEVFTFTNVESICEIRYWENRYVVTCDTPSRQIPLSTPLSQNCPINHAIIPCCRVDLNWPVTLQTSHLVLSFMTSLVWQYFLRSEQMYRHCNRITFFWQ